MTKTNFIWPSESGGKQRLVHQFGVDGNPTIVLLHELAGVTPEIDDLAQALEGKGYRVFVPVMLPSSGGANLVRICLSGEFTTLASGRSSPVMPAGRPQSSTAS